MIANWSIDICCLFLKMRSFLILWIWHNIDKNISPKLNYIFCFKTKIVDEILILFISFYFCRGWNGRKVFFLFLPPFFNFLKYQKAWRDDLLGVLKNCRTTCVRSRGKFTEKAKKNQLPLWCSLGIYIELFPLFTFIFWRVVQGCVFLAHISLGFPKSSIL